MGPGLPIPTVIELGPPMVGDNIRHCFVDLALGLGLRFTLVSVPAGRSTGSRQCLDRLDRVDTGVFVTWLCVALGLDVQVMPPPPPLASR
jgi:hypothetical protein